MNFREALDRIPAPGAGCHGGIMTAANVGILQGHTPDDVYLAIRAAVPTGKRRVPDREIKDAVEKASRECTTNERKMTFTPPPPPPPKVDGGKLLAGLAKRSEGATIRDLQARSPVELTGIESVLLLQALYRPDEFLFIGGTYDKEVDTVENHVERLTAGASSPFVCPNPFDGAAHATSAGGMSFRCDAAVAAFRFTVVENDVMPLADQIAFWHSIIEGDLLPVSALIHSGGKSIHAWLAVDAADAVDYRARVDALWTFLEPMVFDRATRNPARLSRLPGFERKPGRFQQLLFLNQTNDPKQKDRSQ